MTMDASKSPAVSVRVSVSHNMLVHMLWRLLSLQHVRSTRDFGKLLGRECKAVSEGACLVLEAFGISVSCLCSYAGHDGCQ